jgi:hypothetical protein
MPTRIAGAKDTIMPGTSQVINQATGEITLRDRKEEMPDSGGLVRKRFAVSVAELAEVGVVHGSAVVEVERGAVGGVGGCLAERVSEGSEVPVVDARVAVGVAEETVKRRRERTLIRSATSRRRRSRVRSATR